MARNVGQAARQPENESAPEWSRGASTGLLALRDLSSPLVDLRAFSGKRLSAEFHTEPMPSKPIGGACGYRKWIAEVLSHPRLNAGDKALAKFLHSHSSTCGYVDHPSGGFKAIPMTEIAAVMGCSLRTAGRRVGKLMRAGYIDRWLYYYGGNCYSLTLPGKAKKGGPHG